MINFTSPSKAHFEVSRQQFSSFAAKALVPGSSYYVASLMRGASEESLENKGKILSRLLTVGWIASAGITAVGSAIQNIISAPLNLLGRVIQLKFIRAFTEFSLALLHAIQNIFFIALVPLLILFALIYPKGIIGPLFTGQAWEKGALHTHQEYIKQPVKEIDASWKSEIQSKTSFTKSIARCVESKMHTAEADPIEETKKPESKEEKKPVFTDAKKKKLGELQTQLNAIQSKPDKRFSLQYNIDNKPQSVVLSMANRGHLLLLKEIVSQAASDKKIDALNSVKIESDFRQQETFLTEMNYRFNPLAPHVNRTHDGKYLVAIQVMLTQVFDPSATPFGERKLLSGDLQRYLQPDGPWSILEANLDAAIQEHLEHFKAYDQKVVFLQNLKKTLTTLVKGIRQDPQEGYEKGIVLLTQTIESLSVCEKMKNALEFYTANESVKIDDLDKEQKALFEKGKLLSKLSEEQKKLILQEDVLGNLTAKEILQELCMARFAYVPMHDYKQQQIENVHGELPGKKTALTLDTFYEKFKEVNTSLFTRTPAQAQSSLAYAKQHICGNVGMNFYPIARHNIPHVHGTIERKNGRTEILQHSTPTIQKGPFDLITKTVKVSPDYEFWISTCREKNQKILSVIHESCDGVEGIRQGARMNLAKKHDNFYALTLPLEGPLFNGYKADMTWKDFKEKLTKACTDTPKGSKTPMGIVISESVRKLLPKEEIERILDETQQLFFKDLDKITSQRQYHALLALFYVHLTEQIEDKLHFDFLHMGCKDDQDRGGTMKTIFAIYHLLASGASDEQIGEALQALLVEYTGQPWLNKKQGVLLKRANLLSETLELIKGKHTEITENFAQLKTQDEYKIVQYHPGITTGSSFFVQPGLREGHSPEQTKRLNNDQLRLTLDPSLGLHEIDGGSENNYDSNSSNSYTGISGLDEDALTNNSLLTQCGDEESDTSFTSVNSSLDNDGDKEHEMSLLGKCITSGDK